MMNIASRALRSMRTFSTFLPLSIILSASLPLAAQETRSCAALREYRDVEAPRAWTRAALDYTLAADNWAAIAEARAAILDDETWGIADWSLLTATAASEIKSELRLIAGMLKLDPASGKPSSVRSESAAAPQMLKALDAGAVLPTIVSDAFAMAAGKEYLAQIVPVGDAVAELWAYADAIRSAPDRHATWRDTVRMTLRGQLDRLDTRLRAYDSAMAASAEKSTAMTALDEAVETYCRRFGAADALAGTWISTDSLRRFSLTFDGATCTWTERSAEGGELVRKLPVSVEAGQLRVYRPNDDSVLAFLGFKEALRAEMLAKHPEPSFLILTQETESEKGGGGLKGEWHGVVAIKDMKAKLKSLKQPREVEGKEYVFRRN